MLVSEVRGFDTSFERHDDPHADGGPRGRYAPRGVHQRGAKRQGCEDMRETMRGGATSRRSEAGVEGGGWGCNVVSPCEVGQACGVSWWIEASQRGVRQHVTMWRQ